MQFSACLGLRVGRKHRTEDDDGLGKVNSNGNILLMLKNQFQRLFLFA